MPLTGHKKKGKEELAWSAIKKMVAARVNLEITIYRERRMNEILDGLWKQFESEMQAGRLAEGDMAKWVEAALKEMPALEQ